MGEDKEMQELLKPIPFCHGNDNFWSACGVQKDRSRGVTYQLEQYVKKKIDKRSMVIEFIESAMDLTRREQIILAFKLGQEYGRK